MPHHSDASALMRSTLRAVRLHAEDDEELQRTPERFTELLTELTSGLHEPTPAMSVFPAPGHTRQPVLLCALPFHSLCVHHLMPFFGTVDVAYIPGEVMVGFGSIARSLDHVAKRPQVQERLVEQLAQLIQEELSPRGVLVRCRARQMCMELRGAKKRGVLISTAARGDLMAGPVREEVLRQMISAEEPI